MLVRLKYFATAVACSSWPALTLLSAFGFIDFMEDGWLGFVEFFLFACPYIVVATNLLLSLYSFFRARIKEGFLYILFIVFIIVFSSIGLLSGLPFYFGHALSV